MTNLAQRALTGIFLVLIIVASILAGPVSFVALILFLNSLGLLEFYRLFHVYTQSPRYLLGLLLSVTLLVTSVLGIAGIGDWRILFINIPIATGIFIGELYLKSIHPVHNLAFIFAGLIGITVPLVFFVALPFTSKGNYDPNILLGYFSILWVTDSGAYFTGRKFGKKPLFLRLSPKKTWEGSLGGAICGLLVALVLARLIPTFSLPTWLAIAVLIIFTGTMGDLIKSLMKRSLNIKDAGTILPGHGGILDRFDSLLGSAPFVFCYLSLVGYA